ncbi:MAG TPA: substrate-binding domain-containing protein, partial [Aggregatilineales bacterium]|nr:substrate-binding domain-containing protein [Aggregatilineales bacterium]
TDQRSEGFREAIAEFPGMELVGEDFNEDDANRSVEQTTAVLQRESDLVGIFGTNVFSAQGAGTAVVNEGLGGVVQVIAFDATQFAIEQLNAGVVSLVIAQKPYDMGYLAVEFAMAHSRGVTSLPTRVPTGYAVITAENVSDPEVARFIYQVD